MKHWTAVIGTLAVLGLGPGTAHADVTAEEVWQNWQDLTAAAGQSYSAGTILRGDGTLTLQDVSVTAAGPGTTLQGSIDEIAFREQGDGTVAIAPSPAYSLTVETAQPGGGMVVQQVTVIQDGLDLVASGTPDAITYDFTAEAMSLRAEGPTSARAGSAMQLAVTAEDVAGRYGVTAGTPPALTSDLAARTLALTLQATEPGSQIAFDLQAADISATGHSTPGFFTNPAGVMAQGQGTDSTLSYTDLRVSLETGRTGATRTMGAGADTGTLTVAIDDGGLQYGVETTGLTLAMSGAGVTLPQISARLNSATANLRAPILVGDTPEDFALRIDLDQLALADMVWNSLDPNGLVTRDPAHLTIDLSGQANWLTDIRDMTQHQTQLPAALHALQVYELRLSGGGAELTGSGAFTFDNTDLTTFRGLPAPDGTLELQASGANALIDNLVTLGLIPPEQAFFARILAAPFLEAGNGPDTLQTRIDIGPDGNIRANGRRVR